MDRSRRASSPRIAGSQDPSASRYVAAPVYSGVYRSSGERSSAPLRVLALDPRTLEKRTIDAWRALETRALEPNAYLSPDFVLPALAHLDREAGIIALFVEALQPSDEKPHIVGVLLAQVSPGVLAFPLPHLRAYRSRHSYLSGTLLDKDYATSAMSALLEYIASQSSRWHGLEFEWLWGDGESYDVLRDACERLNLPTHERHGFSRAVLFPQRDREQIEEAVKAELHALRRKVRRLREQGEVRWTLAPPGSISQAAEKFMDLEHLGWKGDGGSSLRSSPGGESFFREMSANFAANGRALFAELLLNDRVIASTSNFSSSGSGFAFKIGWEPEFAKSSPGMLAELELMRALARGDDSLPLGFWDSGTNEGSYIDRLWSSRRRVVTLSIASSWMGAQALRLVNAARGARRRWAASGLASKLRP